MRIKSYPIYKLGLRFTEARNQFAYTMCSCHFEKSEVASAIHAMWEQELNHRMMQTALLFSQLQ